MRNFWRVLDSNARAAISNNGCDFPQRIYPYASLSYVPDHQKEKQDNLNQWAKYALEFRGGTWKEED